MIKSMPLGNQFKRLFKKIINWNYLIAVIFLSSCLNISSTPSFPLLFLPSFLGALLIFISSREGQNTNLDSEFTLGLCDSQTELKLKSKTLIPPILNLLSPKDLTEIILSPFPDQHKLDYADLIFRILRNLFLSSFSWNLKSLVEAIKDPELFYKRIEIFAKQDDKLFFEALSQNLISVDTSFISTLEKISSDLWFLRSGFSPIFDINQNLIVTFTNSCIESRLILESLLKRVNIKYYFYNSEQVKNLEDAKLAADN